MENSLNLLFNCRTCSRALKSCSSLNKAFITQNHEHRWVCSVADVEEAKAVLRLVPIWATCLVFAIVFAQPSTLFVKQGATRERTIFSGFKIPAASLRCIIGLVILTFIPIYDRIFVPIARALTRKRSGITLLQRIRTGIFLIIFILIIAALVEIRRLITAKEYNLVDKPSSTIPMSIWWLVPQYLLLGIADVFTLVCLQEFFLSSFLVLVIDKATGGNGRDSWFSSNLNRAHLVYFYWLLAGLGAIEFVAYLYFARSYIFNGRGTH